jgi:hypothetical protein
VNNRPTRKTRVVARIVKPKLSPEDERAREREFEMGTYGA